MQAQRRVGQAWRDWGIESAGGAVKFTFEQRELENELASARSVEALEPILQKVVNLIGRVRDPENYGCKLFSSGFDRLVPDLVRRLRMSAAPTVKSNDNVCVVATRFYNTGGHTRVARDFIRLLGPERPPTLILTDLNREIRYQSLMGEQQLGSSFAEHACLILSAGTLVEKTIELFMMLRASRPTRIVLMCHPFDIVAVLATWPFRDIVDFVHHVDHVPSLGATLAYSGHIDLTYTCHLACREHGLNAIYAGMTSTLAAPSPRRREPNRLRMATCGDPRKFNGPGRYAWADYAVAALRRPGVEMVHIGSASEDLVRSVHDALAAAGLEPQRYVFAGIKESLPAELIARGIDVYLSSYPETGGKANLEAMLADVPVIVPIEEGLPPLIHFRLPLPRYVEISSPDELGDAIDAALELGATMHSPEQVRIRDREIRRFDDFVAGRPLAPVPEQDLAAGLPVPAQ
jgi:hypothetical protein